MYRVNELDLDVVSRGKKMTNVCISVGNNLILLSAKEEHLSENVTASVFPPDHQVNMGWDNETEDSDVTDGEDPD